MALSGAFIDLAPLRVSRRFRMLWLGRAFSAVGGQMSAVAVMFQVWQQTGSTIWTGAVGLAHALPLVLFGLFAGTLVDRVDRRRFYLFTTIGLATCSAALAVQAFAGGMPVLAVLGVLAVQSTISAGAGPAARSFIPALLPREHVAAGMALNGISFQLSMLVGPALGGLVIGAWGLGACYVVDAASFALAFLGAFGLPAMRPSGPSLPGLAATVEGVRFVLRTPVVRGALLTDLAATALSMPISLFPLVNAERFGNDPRTLGFFLTAIAAGGVAASLLSGTFTRRLRPGIVMIGGSAAWGVFLAVFGLATDPWLGLAALVLAGAADTVTVVSRNTVIQLSTPDGLQGRVLAAEMIVGAAGPDIGNVRAGLVASGTSSTVSLVSGGVLCVAAVLGVAASTPALRTFTAVKRGTPSTEPQPPPPRP
ncbi:MFS transporter [Actinomycetes bacterium KLBMP 9759]